MGQQQSGLFDLPLPAMSLNTGENGPKVGKPGEVDRTHVPSFGDGIGRGDFFRYPGADQTDVSYLCRLFSFRLEFFSWLIVKDLKFAH